MEPMTIGFITVGIFLILMFLGMQIAFAGFLAGFLGIWFLRGLDTATIILGVFPYAQSIGFGFSVVPLFIFMGFLAHRSGMTSEIYSAAQAWVGHLPGGLAAATTYACAIFGAISGSSTATAAVFGKIAIPEMDKYGYNRTLSAGVVAASGTLAALIPPSALIIIFALLAEVSVGKLLIAGIIPGVVSAIIYALMIHIRVLLNPSLARPQPPAPWMERLISLKRIAAVPTIFIVVIGGLYLGIFTPTEAGAAGAFAVLVVTLITRRLTWSAFKEALWETLQTTVMIMITIVGVLLFMRTIALSGITIAFIEFFAGLAVPRLVILIGLLGLFVVLGMFVTATSMMILTVPLIVPVIITLGYDPLWFGIIAIKMSEIALITPPVGLNVYVLRSVLPDTRVEEIFRGVIPFFFMDVLTLALLIAFPQIITFLPNLMLS